MAMARPPSVMVLIDRPKALKTSTVIRIEIGMAASEMSGRAHVHQEQKEDHGDDQRRLHQHALHVGDRGLDEGRLPELDLVGGDALRQRLLDAVELRLDGARQR